MNISGLMRMVADSLDGVEAKFRAQVDENLEAGIDSQSTMDAVITLGATGAAALMQMFESIPRPNTGCRCHNQCNCSQMSSATSENIAIEDEVEKVASRMGFVQEDELAALRKRVVELEEKLNSSNKL